MSKALIERIAIERHLIRKILVEHNANGPHVALTAVWFVINDLGRDVVWSSDDLLEILLALDGGETEVNKFDGIVFIEHDIFGLNVSMDYILRITVLNGLYYSCEVEDCIFFRGLSFLIYELASCHQLHAKVYELLVFISLVVLDNIWMIDLLHKPDLILQSI